MSKIYVWICLAFLLVGSLGVAAQEDTILGKAGDYVIKKSDVDRLLTYYPPETLSRLQENPAEMETLVKRMLEVKIIADLAKKEEFDQQTQIRKQLAYVMDDFLSKEYLSKVVMKNVTVSEADLKEYYTRNKEKLGVPEQVRARHILFKVDPDATEDEKKQVKAKADAILKRLKVGEDFEKLARIHSDDQTSKIKGGDLGYFSTGQMVPEFEGAAFYTDPGEISDIVETKYGYHIIKVEEHTEARERSFEEMKDYIGEQLRQQVVMFKVQRFIAEAVTNAGMQVYSDRIVGE